MKFGEKITLLRKERDVSQQTVAKELGIHAPVLGKYERNEMKPSIEIAKKIADFYSVTLDYLVSETGKSVKDESILNMIYEIDDLTPDKKDFVINATQALIRDAKAQKAYSN